MRKSLTTVLGLALLILGASLVTPMAAAAQAGEDCWMCHTDPEDDDLHWDDSSYFYEAYPPDYIHLSKGTGSCGDAHQIPVCPPAPVALEFLVNAVTTRDIEAVLELYSSSEGRVILNTERKAIQVTSCSDEDIIVAHLPIDETSFDSIAASVTAAPVATELPRHKRP